MQMILQIKDDPKIAIKSWGLIEAFLSINNV